MQGKRMPEALPENLGLSPLRAAGQPRLELITFFVSLAH